jgi:hypothetical protein
LTASGLMIAKVRSTAMAGSPQIVPVVFHDTGCSSNFDPLRATEAPARPLRRRIVADRSPFACKP